MIKNVCHFTEISREKPEDGGVAAASLSDLAVPGSGSLQCAAAGGAHSDDPVACGLGLADAPGGLLADGVPLAVHLMVGDLVLLHRSEGAQTNVQGDLGNADPHGADGVHQLRGKVQPGGGEQLRCPAPWHRRSGTGSDPPAAFVM